MNFPNFTLIDHPLVQTRLATLRDAHTAPAEFRRCLHDITRMMAYEIMRPWATEPVQVTTPLTTMECRRLVHPPILAPILRAGLGMLHAMQEVLPEAKVAHIGMYRNEETKRPESYYFRAPAQLAGSEVVLLDPMLATGHSACAAAEKLIAMGAERISFACIICAPEGLAEFQTTHPNIPVYAAACDAGLTDRAFITPGLGDAGDRYFGTV
jgi:uracil phosphoribosyltransferase